MNIETPAGDGRTHWKRSFFTIAAGQAVSLIGSSAVQFALIWWLASETASPIMMSLAGLAAFLPQMLLGPFVGVWIDRLPRKTIIIGADLFLGIAATCYAVALHFWELPAWTVCLVLGIRGIGGVFHAPAIQAAIPMLVPKEELLRVNGWTQFLISGANILGPAIGAAMYAALPLPVILLSDLIGAIAACLAVAVVKIPELAHEEQKQPDFIREIREGAVIYLNDKKLLIVTLATLGGMIFFAPLSTYYPLMTSDYFKGTAWDASFVEITFALGMMLGAIAFSQFGRIQNKLNVVQLGLMALGATALISGILPQNRTGFWIFAVVCLAMGGSMNVFNIPYTAYLQETIPHEAQGRVFSLLGSMTSFTMPVGLLIAGPVAEAEGVSFWFLITGVVVIIAALASMAALRRYEQKAGA